MSIDRLSALPDSILCHILSFLEMKYAAITTVLSKRWQFLWTELPGLVFWESNKETEHIRKFVARVHRTLVNCIRNNLERFEVDFEYSSCFACDVNAWVEFAVKKNVKTVSLMLNSEKEFFHRLPQMMYSNSSLTSLFVRGCNLTMAPRRTIEWQSLTELLLEEVELPQHVIEKILSGCPVLHWLHLLDCEGFNRLEANSPSLYKLEIQDFEDKDKPLLEISAPYIHSLDLKLYHKGRKLRVTNIPSVVRANIDVIGPYWHVSSEEVMSKTKQLFENIQHVKELELGLDCIEVLSMMVVNGWKLPQSRRGCLKIEAYCNGESISGIIGLLESSPNLETLVVGGFCNCGHGESLTLDPTAKGDLDCNLLHLKTVRIIHFAGEPMLKLAQTLLKRAVVLQKMVIEVKDTASSSDLFKITQTLLSYPRSSQEAVVLLHE